MPTNEPTLIPSDEPLELAVPTADIDADDTAVINAQAAIEKDTIDWAEGFRKFQNFEVAAYFERVSEDSLPMQSQKDYWSKMTTITEDDGIIKALGKFMLFDRVRGSNLDTKDLAKVYGIPIEEFGENVRYKPQITIKFIESEINQQDTPVRNRKLVKRISFRLFGEYIPKNRGELGTLRQKIIDTFSGVSYLVSKDNTYTYRDLEKGYRMAIDAEKDVFTELVTKVLSIQGDTYDDRYAAKGDVNRPETPQTTEVLGETKTLPFRGRWGTVYFWKAEYKQAGIEDKILADNYPLELQ